MLHKSQRAANVSVSVNKKAAEASCGISVLMDLSVCVCVGADGLAWKGPEIANSVPHTHTHRAAALDSISVTTPGD